MRRCRQLQPRVRRWRVSGVYAAEPDSAARFWEDFAVVTSLGRVAQRFLALRKLGVFVTLWFCIVLEIEN